VSSLFLLGCAEHEMAKTSAQCQEHSKPVAMDNELQLQPYSLRSTIIRNDFAHSSGWHTFVVNVEAGPDIAITYLREVPPCAINSA
jgi:hypothetical protein